ncbi:MAG: hypothetical protein SGPRY_000536 [Prymnesium sp.]
MATKLLRSHSSSRSDRELLLEAHSGLPKAYDPLKDLSAPIASLLQVSWKSAGFSPKYPRYKLNSAARRIQAEFRARRRRKKLSEPVRFCRSKRQYGKQDVAAVTIQSSYRVKKSRRILKKLQDEKEEEEMAAYYARKREEAARRSKAFKPVHAHSELESAARKIEIFCKQSGSLNASPERPRRSSIVFRKRQGPSGPPSLAFSEPASLNASLDMQVSPPTTPKRSPQFSPRKIQFSADKPPGGEVPSGQPGQADEHSKAAHTGVGVDNESAKREVARQLEKPMREPN